MMLYWFKCIIHNTIPSILKYTSDSHSLNSYVSYVTCKIIAKLQPEVVARLAWVRARRGYITDLPMSIHPFIQAFRAVKVMHGLVGSVSIVPRTSKDFIQPPLIDHERLSRSMRNATSVRAGISCGGYDTLEAV